VRASFDFFTLPQGEMGAFPRLRKNENLAALSGKLKTRFWPLFSAFFALFVTRQLSIWILTFNVIIGVF
jgi:hypothetical protein